MTTAEVSASSGSAKLASFELSRMDLAGLMTSPIPRSGRSTEMARTRPIMTSMKPPSLAREFARERPPPSVMTRSKSAEPSSMTDSARLRGDHLSIRDACRLIVGDACRLMLDVLPRRPLAGSKMSVDSLRVRGRFRAIAFSSSSNMVNSCSISRIASTSRWRAFGSSFFKMAEPTLVKRSMVRSRWSPTLTGASRKMQDDIARMRS
mmetsp:Transcript_11843/g.35073  ORF Transcript_11843/g.35073 Transcript_11843/m.35073 type:complete len:207 (-) Transcript_11843:209-829(-)